MTAQLEIFGPQPDAVVDVTLALFARRRRSGEVDIADHRVPALAACLEEFGRPDDARRCRAQLRTLIRLGHYSRAIKVGRTTVCIRNTDPLAWRRRL